jgi:hypothetical protein
MTIPAGPTGRALGSFFAFLEDGGRERVQDIGPSAMCCLRVGGRQAVDLGGIQVVADVWRRAGSARCGPAPCDLSHQ